MFDMPAWLLLALSACVLLGAVATAVPGPRLRHQMRMRRRAASLGFQVRVLGARNAAVVRSLGDIAAGVAYRLPHPVGATGAEWVAARSETGWRWRSAPPAAALADQAILLLDELPGDACAAVGEAGAISVYWNEATEPAAVDAMRAALGRLRRLPGMTR